MERDINLRHLRLLLALIDTGSITRAAAACNVSQPAATQGLKALEARFGIPLLDRTAHGLFPNQSALRIIPRIRRAIALLDDAANAIAPRLKLTATAARLKAVIAVAEAGNSSLASQQLNVSQPTVHRAITTLEGEIGSALFRRTSFGSTPTRSGLSLARAAQQAFAELSQAEMELVELRGKGTSCIVIGGMPLSRSVLLPRAISLFHEAYPNIRVRVLEGPYETLLEGLRSGKIDMLFGALRTPPPVDDICQTHLFDDSLAILAGPSHTLARQDKPDLNEAVRYPWVVAIPETPVRDHFDAFISRYTESGPACLVETSSMILMRELLQAGQYLGCLSRRQAESEMRAGLMVALPFEVGDAPRPIGITTRASWTPTKSQKTFMEIVGANLDGPSMP